MQRLEDMTFLGGGQLSDAYLTQDNRVLLVGKREDAFSVYKSLFEKLKLIDGKITSVNIPDNADLIEPNADLMYGGLIQKRIVGTELKNKAKHLSHKQKESIGRKLAKFIKEMHAIPCTFDKQKEMDINISKYDRSLAIIKDYIPSGLYRELEIVKNEYKAFMESSAFYLTHGDLQCENIMLNDDGSISGIIDFGNMEYYVPEVEFVGMLGYDDDIFTSMLNFYNQDIRLKNILLVKLVSLVRHFRHVISFGDKAINENIETIKALTNKYMAVR